VAEENGRTGKKTCSSANLSTANFTWTDLESNSIFCVERPTTKHLSHVKNWKGISKKIMKLYGLD
jgi:hypothetical protein